jgi:hypothetical protein
MVKAVIGPNEDRAFEIGGFADYDDRELVLVDVV